MQQTQQAYSTAAYSVARLNAAAAAGLTQVPTQAQPVTAGYAATTAMGGLVV